MSKFNFKRLIKKYSYGTVAILADTAGYYDQKNGGAWVPGEIIQTVIDPAAIVPLNKDDLAADEGGVYNRDSRKLYCYEELKKGTIIRHTHTKGSIKDYKINEDANYGDFDTYGDGLFIYLMQRSERD